MISTSPVRLTPPVSDPDHDAAPAWGTGAACAASSPAAAGPIERQTAVTFTVVAASKIVTLEGTCCPGRERTNV